MDTEQSCISLHRFGTTNETVGSFEKSVGKASKVWAEPVETLLKPNHGLCFCAYLPLLQVVEPSDGSDSL
ncbi:hypothetical protein Srufu_004890 [Streptomyces libani subsp. rufus]|nr:hypothetical protein Srufu_004890 [Streptomyces libani subsp. rufus]